MFSPAGATASPEESQDKIESLRFKSSSDSRRIPRLLEENVVALDKVWVQYNILFPNFRIPSVSQHSFPTLKFPCKRSTAVF